MISDTLPSSSASFGADLARLVIDSAADFSIIALTADGRITGWNLGAERLFHWTAAEAIGQHTRIIFLPADQEAGTPEDEMARALAGGRSVNERWHARKDGSRFWGSGLLMPLNPAGGARRGFVKMLRDRTVERESERRFQALTDALPGFVFVTDPDGHQAQVNAEYRRYTGKTDGELLGDRWLQVIHPDDRSRAQETWERTLKGEDSYAHRIRFRRKDGVYRCFDCRAVAQRDEDGRPLQWIGTCIDVENEAQAKCVLEDLNRNLERAVTTRTAELEAQLEARLKAEAALRQSQKMEAIGQLTGGVAHDFNNLLTVIRSSADLLRREGLPPEKHRRYVDAIAETADRAAKLTRQLLAFARREALKPVAFDVGDRLHSIVELLRTMLGAQITVDLQIVCSRCIIEADPTQFDTAIINMAVNARDAMDGAGTLTLTVDAAQELPALRGHGASPGDYVAVSMRDTGEGIDPENLSRIFEPFFTTKEVGKGTGLGLSQVFGFAKQSGGDVDVRSVRGEGTTFTLYFSRAPDAVQRGEATSLLAGSQPVPGKGRVLVVEDNHMVGEFAGRLLDELGYAATCAPNADAALALLAERRDDFDILFTDVVMPGMSGLELANEVQRRWPDLPVVLTSGYAHVLAQEGTHGFPLLQKPYSADTLSRTLAKMGSA